MIVEKPREGVVWVLFENDGSRRRFQVSAIPSFLQLDPEDVSPDSPLRDEGRWDDLSVYPADFDAEKHALDPRRCQVCDQLLRESQDLDNDRWKSCPSCSRGDGERHIYYRRPEAFGTSPTRVTVKNKDGVQSHCEACRLGKEPPKERKVCGA